VEVERTMTREIVTCRSEDSLEQAARRMRVHDVGGLPVVDGHGRLAGMLTDRDICMAALERGRPLGDITVREAMTHQVVTVEPGDSLVNAAERMGQFQVHRLPVVDDGGRPVGLLTLLDLARRAACGEMRASGDVGMDDVNLALVAIGRPWAGEEPSGPAHPHDPRRSRPVMPRRLRPRVPILRRCPW